ncbi:hypothetical protein CRG98_033644 [Punica granatum]|uniref:Pinin/SDK/MemA protein domain-containing protein n=1 Tax=Punica granatum TaxID=22663 RepID=A0A2I0IPS5_PUNGR|nr:hypothetical protein CRG98_033644 [Punica granatum]
MASTEVEKTEEELRKEIDELHRQQREITERLRDPRGLRRGTFSGAGPRNVAANGARPRGLIRPADRADREDQPPSKRRLLSAVVKVEDGEITEDAETAKDAKNVASTKEGAVASANDGKVSDLHRGGGFGRDGNRREPKTVLEALPSEHVPRVLPKNEDPSLVNRNKRMLGQLLGTLEKFRKEDMKLSGTEAYMRRNNSLQRAEQKAREESEKLRQQEREQIAEKRKQDLTLRARVAAKAEEKKLELLFLRWSEHQRKLCNFIRLFLLLVQKTKTKPPIYYLPTKPVEEDAASAEQAREQTFLEWKAARRQELSEYQKQIGEQYIANVEKQLERWQNARKARKGNNNEDMLNLQETMDKELDTHRLEHGPKTRKIPGSGSNEDDEDDVEDINAGEDDMMDDVLGVEDNRRAEDLGKTE